VERVRCDGDRISRKRVKFFGRTFSRDFDDLNSVRCKREEMRNASRCAIRGRDLEGNEKSRL